MGADRRKGNARKGDVNKLDGLEFKMCGKHGNLQSYSFHRPR